jgi:hypothetical protein
MHSFCAFCLIAFVCLSQLLDVRDVGSFLQLDEGVVIPPFCGVFVYLFCGICRLRALMVIAACRHSSPMPL